MTEPWDGVSAADPRAVPGPRAGFWQRFGASFIDGLIVGLVAEILDFVLSRPVASVAGVLISVSYYVSLEGGPRGAGLGKQFMGIRVIDLTTGQPIGSGRAFIRWIGRLVSFVCLLLGYFWMLWDPQKQCWHDKFAGDVVVPTSAYPVQAPTWR
jgi:uncharacterized RDD family membrane protein YckC